jgi:hypothetical protein
MRCGGIGLLALAAFMANAQQLDLPWGPVKRLASPDGSKVLYGVPYQAGRNDGPQFWMEDTRTHHRRKLLDIPSTLSAGWSPDGTKFYVNDHLGSDEENAYIYDAATLERIDLGARIQAADPASHRFAKGHAYYQVTRWEGSDEVAVKFFGHTDEPPVTDFDFRYRVSRAGSVKKLSQHSAPVKG